MLHSLAIMPGQTITDRTVPQGQNLMSPLITPIVQIVVGKSLLHKTPLPGGFVQCYKIRFARSFHSLGSLVFLPFCPACTLGRRDFLASGR
jgi:hypothetical protein